MKMNRCIVRMALVALAVATLGRSVVAQTAASRQAVADGFSEAAFNTQLEAIGQMSVENFETRYHSGTQYMGRIGWDPTNAFGWKELNTIRDWDETTLALNQEETEVFRRNGFVVSERLAYDSFGDLYDAIYKNDLPVIVTCDMILHAWHRSFDLMLKELELYCLRPTLESVLRGMAEELPKTRREFGSGCLEDAVLDTDFYLGVARSLLAGRQVATLMGQDKSVSNALEVIQAEKYGECLWFGTNRVLDASQFKPRGHYSNDPLLRTYFQAMMWLCRMDLRIGDGQGASPRQLGMALVLNHLLTKSGKRESWSAFDTLVSAFIGHGDALDFDGMDRLMQAASIESIGQIKNESQIEALAALATARGEGIPRISVGFSINIDDPNSLKVPVSFSMLDQRFTPDAWALAKVGGDSVKHDGKIVPRRMASAIDVAFSVFSNNAVTPNLVSRMNATNGVAFRDGWNYAPNLVATRNIIDTDVETWANTLYGQWLLVLRELSSPTTSSKYPQAMRTRAWAMKTLNTQLASWTQLKHDTVLYAKEPEYVDGACLYPKGYVEPRVEFWGRFEQMVIHAAELVEDTPYPEGRAFLDNRDLAFAGEENVGAKSTQALKIRQASFLRNFALVLGTLKEIAHKEVLNIPFTKREITFLQDIIEIQKYYNGTHAWNGWYPQLFHGAITDCEVDDALASAVLTDCPDVRVGDPGAVLHEAVGNVNFMVVAIEDGGTNVVYAGGVMSHYEFSTPFGQRLTDDEWRKQSLSTNRPAFPEWTREFLVPGLPEWARYLTDLDFL